MTAQAAPESGNQPSNQPGQQVVAWSQGDKGEAPNSGKPDGQPSSKDGKRPSSSEKKMRDQGLFGFTDPASVKEQVKRSLEKQQPYSVFMYYKDEADSFWPRIAKHSVFENVTLGVISVNAAYIAIDTDWNKLEPLTPTDTYSLQEAGAFFVMMEHLFCFYFTFEWVCRFMSFKVKKNGLKDGWFVFDSVLVFMMVVETWVMSIITAIMGGGGAIQGASILRLIRLLRLSRLMRMLRSLTELMILIKGMVTAMKSVAYVMALLILLTYVFAIAFTQLAVNTYDEYGEDSVGDKNFANIGLSMYSLLIYATLLDDLIAFCDDLRHQSPVLLVLAFIYIALAALTVMNMLIGVLCEIVSAVADNEQDEIRTTTLSIKMKKVVGDFDSDHNKLISYKEFTEILMCSETLDALEVVGVSPVCLVDFAEFFFYEDGKEIQLTFEDFMEMVLDLRESNTATVKDMLNVWMKIKSTSNKDLGEVKRTVDNITKNFDEKSSELSSHMEGIEHLLNDGMKEIMKLSKHETV